MYVLSLGSKAFAQDLQIKDKMKSAVLTAEKIKAMDREIVKVIDPNETAYGSTVTSQFTAIDGQALLDLAFGSRKDWQEKTTLVVSCSDGYKTALEIKRFRDGGFYFATGRPDSKEFSIINRAKDGKKALLSPYYLIWVKPELQTKALGYYWPYQVVGLEIL